MTDPNAADSTGATPAPQSSLEHLSFDQDDERTSESGRSMGFHEFRLCLWRLLRPYRPQFAVAFCSMLASSVLAAALPLSIKFIADYGLRPPASLKLLLVILGCVLCAGALCSATFLLWDYAYSRIAAGMLTDLRLEMYRHLQHLSMSFYARVPAGDIASRFMSDFGVA